MPFKEILIQYNVIFGYVLGVGVFAYVFWLQLRKNTSFLKIFDIIILFLIFNFIFSYLVSFSSDKYRFIDILFIALQPVVLVFAGVFTVTIYNNLMKNKRLFLFLETILISLIPFMIIGTVVFIINQIDLGVDSSQKIIEQVGYLENKFPINYIRLVYLFIFLIVFVIFKPKIKKAQTLFSGLFISTVAIIEFVLRYSNISYRPILLGSLDLLQLISISLLFIGVYLLINFFSSYETEEELMIGLRKNLKYKSSILNKKRPEHYSVSYQSSKSNSLEPRLTIVERFKKQINKFKKTRIR